MKSKNKSTITITLLFAFILLVGSISTACFSGANNKDQSTPVEQSAAPRQSVTTTEPVPTASPVDDDNSTITEEGDWIAAVKEFDYLLQFDIESVELDKTEEFFGDKLNYYYVNEYDCGFRILDSDNSLVAFSSKEVDMTMTMQLSDDALIEIATNVVKKVWGYDDVSVVSHEVTKWEPSDGTIYIFEVRGVMGIDKREFYVGLNGKGEIVSLGSYPENIDYSKGISMEEAEEIAEKFINEDIMIRHLLKEVKLEEGGPLELVSAYLSENHLQIYILPIYIFNYEYRLDNPTVENFDCDIEIGFHMSNGKMGLFRVIPIIDNIDVIQKDEAEQLAIEYLAENTEHKDVSKYLMTHMQAIVDRGKIVYFFRFDYGDAYSYSTIMVATGGFWSMQKEGRVTNK